MLINNTPLKECYRLGKYAAEHGLNHFKSKNFKEGTADTFESKYHVINDSAIKKHSPKKVLNIKKGWRSILLKKLDTKIQKFLIVTINCGTVINISIAIPFANGF